MERASELLGKLAAEESLILAVFGGPRKKSQPVRKVSLRPVLLKDALHYQAEYTYEKKVTHENLLPEEVEAFAERQLQNGFKQADIFSTEADYTVLANKPDHEKILKKKPTKTMGPLAHNREKNYAIPDGTPVDFLVRLGVQTRDGQIVPKHRNKFRQINRFLEIAEDCLEYLPKEPVIIDFGCGKSYLTFALYWYLNVKNDYKAKLVGLDLKEDVIAFCSGRQGGHGRHAARLRHCYGFRPAESPHLECESHPVGPLLPARAQPSDPAAGHGSDPGSRDLKRALLRHPHRRPAGFKAHRVGLQGGHDRIHQSGAHREEHHAAVHRGQGGSSGQAQSSGGFPQAMRVLARLPHHRKRVKKKPVSMDRFSDILFFLFAQGSHVDLAVQLGSGNQDDVLRSDVALEGSGRGELH